jgi:hypothetical protein
MIKIAGFDEILALHDSEADALEAFQTPDGAG